MADEDKAVENESAEQTAEEEPRQPSETEEPTESVKPSETESEPAEKPEKTPEETEDDIPEEALEAMDEKQRKAFQRQRQQIKALKDEVAKRKQAQSALEALSPKVPRQTLSQRPNAQNFINDEGAFDVVGYENAVNDYQAKQEARIMAKQSQTQYETDRKLLAMREPKLDPRSEQHDLVLEKRVADRYGRLLMETLFQGKPEPSLVDVAADVLKEFGPSQKEKTAISKEALEKVSQKGQAASAAEAPSTSARGKASIRDSEKEALSERAKHGDLNALTELIAAIEGTRK